MVRELVFAPSAYQILFRRDKVSSAVLFSLFDRLEKLKDDPDLHGALAVVEAEGIGSFRQLKHEGWLVGIVVDEQMILVVRVRKT